jgi:hypothetical protein
MHERPRNGSHGGGGFGEFLRSLVSGLPWSERAECSETVHVDPPPSGVLRIDNANGHTRLIGEERSDVEVVLCKMARAESPEHAQRLAEEIQLVTRQDGDHLNLEFDVPRRWHRRGRVDVELRVPRGLRVEVISSNGRICVRGMRGAVRAKSSNGGVRIEDVVGDIEVSTSNAKVSTQCTCGRLLARSSNGKIELEGHRGSVDAATSNGTIRCELEGMGREGVMLATSNGRIVLDLPEEVDGDVDIRVDNGAIRTARSFEGAARERSGRVRGTLGKGGVPIKLRASNGTISLR